MQVGDRLRIRPADGVSVDGMVSEGRGAVDESMVARESLPFEKQLGVKLIGGTVNGTSASAMQAGKVGSDTMLSRIAAMVSEAQRSRAAIRRMVAAASSAVARGQLAREQSGPARAN